MASGTIQRPFGVADSGWQTLTLTSDFETYATGAELRYRRIGSLVEVIGVVKPTAAIAGGTTQTVIATLPSGYRPVNYFETVCQGSDRNVWMLETATNGELRFSRYRSAGDSYATAAAGAFLPIHVMFFTA